MRDWNQHDPNGEEWLMGKSLRENQIYCDVFGEFNRAILSRQIDMPYEEILEIKKKLNEEYKSRVSEAKEELIQKAREEYKRSLKKDQPEPIPLRV